MTQSNGTPQGRPGTEAYAGFQGKVEKTLAFSEPWWAPEPRPPAGAPNVVVVLMDDMGFSDIGCFGAEVATPNLDRLAAEGVRFANFHVTPLCSPTRAALMTGINHHAAGVGQVIEGSGDAGFPGYRGELAENVQTAAEVFRANGYVTLMAGKWHLTNQATEEGSKSGWPLQRGFDRFYGTVHGATIFHSAPNLVEDNHSLEIDEHPEGYYFTDDITDHAIAMITAAKAGNPKRPFFLYHPHCAVHSPHQAKTVDIEKYRDTYHEGWDVFRERRFRRQKELGIIPANAVLPPRNSEAGHEVQPWDQLGQREKELFARYMAGYAAMIDNVDQNFGKLRAALEAMGEWENTIVVFTSDNGGSRTGRELGTSNFYRTVTQTLPGAGDIENEFDFDYSLLDEMGGPRTFPMYPQGWAMVSNTPWRLYKMNTHNGGHQVPFIVSWPNHLAAHAGAIRFQYGYVTDILPTLVALTGVGVPEERHGKPVKAFTGTSFAHAITDPAAASNHTEQYYEMWGNRGYYREGWDVATIHLRGTKFTGEHWELHDLERDPTQAADLSGELPEKTTELIEAWDKAAWANQVYPLDERVGLNQVRPPGDAQVEAMTLRPGIPRVFSASKIFTQRSFSVGARVDYKPGDQGILLSSGSQAGGFCLYVEDGVLGFAYNYYGRMLGFSGGAVPAGARELALEAIAPGKNIWHFRLLIDRRETGRADGYPMLSGQGAGGGGGVDVGLNRFLPVSWELSQRHGTFRYTGAFDSVTITPGEESPDRGPDYYVKLREMAKQLQ